METLVILAVDILLPAVLELLPTGAWAVVIILLMIGVWYMYQEAQSWKDKYLGVLETTVKTQESVLETLKETPTKQQLNDIKQQLTGLEARVSSLRPWPSGQSPAG